MVINTKHLGNEADVIKMVNRDHPEISVCYSVKVTPFLAGEFLKTKATNRKPSESCVKRYARDITNGKWPYNPGDIAFCFDQKGLLANGLHRSLAIIRANKYITATLCFGCTKEQIRMMDSANKRSAPQQVEVVDGKPRPKGMSTLSAMVRASPSSPARGGATSDELMLMRNEIPDDLEMFESLLPLKSDGRGDFLYGGNRAALLLAWLNGNEDDVALFLEIATKKRPVTAAWQGIALDLMKIVTKHRRNKGSGGGGEGKMFKGTLSAIDQFIGRVDDYQIRFDFQGDAFPFPDYLKEPFRPVPTKVNGVSADKDKYAQASI